MKNEFTIKKTYSEVEIGEEFIVPTLSNIKRSVYMKIDHENNHNHYFVAIEGHWKGCFYAALADNSEVMVRV